MPQIDFTGIKDAGSIDAIWCLKSRVSVTDNQYLKLFSWSIHAYTFFELKSHK